MLFKALVNELIKEHKHEAPGRKKISTALEEEICFYTVKEYRCLEYDHFDKWVPAYNFELLLQIPKPEYQHRNFFKKQKRYQPKNQTHENFFDKKDEIKKIPKFQEIMNINDFFYIPRDVMKPQLSDHLTMTDLLDHNFKAEILQGSNSYQCPNCLRNANGLVKSKTVLLHPPNYLVLTLKRFKRNQSEFGSGDFNYDNTPVEFGESIDMEPYISSN